MEKIYKIKLTVLDKEERDEDQQNAFDDYGDLETLIEKVLEDNSDGIIDSCRCEPA